jgi:hypothetical protein
LVNQKKPKLVSMTTKKENRGGPRPNSGRPPKIQEVKLVEQMDRIAVPDEIWKALLFKIKEGDTQAIKLWLSYRLGLPKQQLDITTNGESIAPPISWLTKEIEFKEVDAIEFDPVENQADLVNQVKALDHQANQVNEEIDIKRIDAESLTRLDE